MRVFRCEPVERSGPAFQAERTGAGRVRTSSAHNRFEYRVAVVREIRTVMARFETFHRYEVSLDQRADLGAGEVEPDPAHP